MPVLSPSCRRIFYMTALVLGAALVGILAALGLLTVLIYLVI